MTKIGPFLVEDELIGLGAVFSKVKDWRVVAPERMVSQRSHAPTRGAPMPPDLGHRAGVLFLQNSVRGQGFAADRATASTAMPMAVLPPVTSRMMRLIFGVSSRSTMVAATSSRVIS